MRNGRNGARTVNADDHHEHGLLALSPLALFCLVIITGVAYYIFTQLQITSTEQSVFGLLQVTSQINPGMTSQQISQFVSGNIDHYQTIAYAIGWAVQIALLILSFPPTSVLLRMHRKYNADASMSLSASAASYAKLQRFLMFTLIGGDVITDFVYVVSGHSLMSWSGFLPSFSGPSVGVLIVAILYPIAICFVTIFVGKYLFVFIDGLVERLKEAAERKQE